MSTSARFEQLEAARQAVLLDALEGVDVTADERRTLRWLAAWEPATVENAVIRRAHSTGGAR